LLPFLSPSGACHECLILLEVVSSVSSLSHSCFRWFPTGLSSYFTFPTLSSSSIYSLLTKLANVIHVLQYLFYIYFCQFNLSHLMCSWVMLSAVTIAIYKASFSSSSILVIWLSFTLLRFFCLKLFCRSIWSCFFVLLTNFILTKHSQPHLSKITLYSFVSLDLLISRLELLFFVFFFTQTISSYYPTRLFSRSVCIPALCHRPCCFSHIFPICLRSFSFLPTIGFATRLPFSL